MGITKREIASELGVSKRTIANYIGKLGLGNHVSRNGNTDILDDFAAAAIADALKNPEKPSRQPAAAAPTPRRSARPRSASAARVPPARNSIAKTFSIVGGSHRRGNLAGGPPRPHRLPVVRSRLRPNRRGSVAAYPIRRQFRMVLLLSLGCAL